MNIDVFRLFLWTIYSTYEALVKWSNLARLLLFTFFKTVFLSFRPSVVNPDRDKYGWIRIFFLYPDPELFVSDPDPGKK